MDKIEFKDLKPEGRFLKYVRIDTQSDPSSESVPSTEKQKNLSRLLVEELIELGLTNVELDENGYTYATLSSNSDKQVPTIFFCSHVDTSPDCSGTNVLPVVHKNFNGSPILFSNDPALKLTTEAHPALLDQLGNDIITADGTTLLGADNKAGVAEIMAAMEYLVTHPEIKHGTVKVLFTPDEEIGRGVDHVNLKKLDADFGYTIDGETLGHIENETFSADSATLVIYGVSTHPGFAKNKMRSAIKIASAIIDNLPKTTLTPETTDHKDGFIHPVQITGGIEKCTVHFILRDFRTEKLAEMANLIEMVTKKVIAEFPGAKFELQIQKQYRNMKEVLVNHPLVTEIAVEAVESLGITPLLSSIRGGTDGSRLSFMGLPCPNIFAGEHAFHSKLEWVSVQDMQKAAATIVRIAELWESKS